MIKAKHALPELIAICRLRLKSASTSRREEKSRAVPVRSAELAGHPRPGWAARFPSGQLQRLL
jgi:hypothetical protein